ncbi:MAG: alpha-galactosidase [Ruminococcus bicirculans]|uniref:alpha-galactosidase n=1 Tax=Ruminococcus bicirculans (ex Wegman et al. 2014) TaxID=1160721 RepID=UPI002430F504|nr:alpha-galactosidase [Ruminococcus bicirculans (ex Wegman et al. 2014)]
MNIFYNEKDKAFKLRANNTDYMMKVCEEGYLAHVYYGNKVPDEDLTYLLRLDESPFTPATNDRDRASFMDTLPFEYPCFGVGDYRESAFKIMDASGMSTCDLRYVSHKMYEGKPKLEGLPATFATEESGCSTLEITMYDKYADIEVVLIYTAFDKLDVITRSAVITNKSEKPFKITRALSACVDFDTDKMDMITLNGSWARERAVERCRLHHGKQLVDSCRGESSHQNNPFVALCDNNADEDKGEVFGFNFVYSGNFYAQAEVTQHKKTRFLMGINPLDFQWLLEKGESFTCPEVVMVHSDEGIGKMSRTFHDLYRNNLIRGEYKDKRRPILINNWEATYFNFDTDKLIDIAKEASKLGIEMLVMDDGWFGHRDSDNSSLGDWFVYEKKLKGGLKYLVDEVNKLGMKFGIWFEPEMISPDSELYKAHPDWAIQIKGRPLTLCREQYVLDYSRKEVRDYVYGMMKKILDSANIEYIKWDMNRQLTEVGSATLPAERQRELWHRYVLGVYDLMDRLTTDYPHILLENCSGGGARFDPGMLYYSPQIWCSDDTDAIERLKIQHGTSMCYPCSAMGAHVSDCPNHTVGRNTPFKTRGHVAMVGTFGYELDVTRIPQEDRDAIPAQIEEFNKFNKLVRTGDHYRIGNMFEDNTWDAWEFVAKDKSEALFEFVQVLAKPNERSRRIKLKGLEPEAYYYEESEPDKKISGAALMNAGINIAKMWNGDGLYGDFCSKILHFIKV